MGDFVADASVEIHVFSDSSGVLFYNVDSEASVIVPCELIKISQTDATGVTSVEADSDTIHQLLQYGFIRRAQ